MATITCEQCGTQRHKCPSNTKLCRPCAVLRDAEYTLNFPPRECSQSNCRNKFAPLSRSDRLCGECSLSMHRGHCNWCGDPEGELVKPELKLCGVCAKDPDKRVSVIKALRNRQAQTREANGWRPSESREAA